MSSTPFDAWIDLWTASLQAMRLAPEDNNQAILPGWFSTTIVNSRSPQTEGAIVSKVSYGRQIGRIMDALEYLIHNRDAPQSAKPFTDLDEIAKEVKEIKDAARAKRLKGLAEDLTAAKQDEKLWAELKPRLRAVLAD